MLRTAQVCSIERAEYFFADVVLNPAIAWYRKNRPKPKHHQLPFQKAPQPTAADVASDGFGTESRTFPATTRIKLTATSRMIEHLLPLIISNKRSNYLPTRTSTNTFFYHVL